MFFGTLRHLVAAESSNSDVLQAIGVEFKTGREINTVKFTGTFGERGFRECLIHLGGFVL